MKNKKLYFGMTILGIIIAILAESFIIYQLNCYEASILEIYGEQQDGYVQLVLNEILAGGEDITEEEITSAISNLDSTISQYWMLSGGERILFVKSVMETNRYKNLTDQTYFAETGAMEFVNSLHENVVSHAVLNMAEGRYVVSGLPFRWRGEVYRVCFMTYDKAILDRNSLLESKNGIIVVSMISLSILLIFSMVMYRLVSKQEKKLRHMDERTILQNKQIDMLDAQLKKINGYSPEKHIFRSSMLREFLNALDENDICPLHFAVFEAKDIKGKKEFLEHLMVMLDEDVLRFSMDENLILLIFAGYRMEESRAIIRELEYWGAKAIKDQYCEDNYRSYVFQFKQFWKGISVWK